MASMSSSNSRIEIMCHGYVHMVVRSQESVTFYREIVSRGRVINKTMARMGLRREE